MALDQQSMPAGDQLAGGAPPPEGAEGAMDQGDTSIHIAADMLPPGIKAGDSLKCTSMDENGCAFELVKGMAEGEGEDWEKGFRESMSPRNPEPPEM